MSTFKNISTQGIDLKDMIYYCDDNTTNWLVREYINRNEIEFLAKQLVTFSGGCTISNGNIFFSAIGSIYYPKIVSNTIYAEISFIDPWTTAKLVNVYLDHLEFRLFRGSNYPNKIENYAYIHILGKL